MAGYGKSPLFAAGSSGGGGSGETFAVAKCASCGASVAVVRGDAPAMYCLGCWNGGSGRPPALDGTCGGGGEGGGGAGGRPSDAGGAGIAGSSGGEGAARLRRFCALMRDLEAEAGGPPERTAVIARMSDTREWRDAEEAARYLDAASGVVYEPAAGRLSLIDNAEDGSGDSGVISGGDW